jgi:hypothetical protein
VYSALLPASFPTGVGDFFEFSDLDSRKFNYVGFDYDGIGSGAVERCPWKGANVRRWLGGGAVLEGRGQQNRVNYHEDGSEDPNFRKLYFDKYVKMDPFTTSQYFAEIGEPMATADVITRSL